MIIDIYLGAEYVARLGVKDADEAETVCKNMGKSIRWIEYKEMKEDD